MVITKETEQLLKDAYEEAYYKGAGDDAWYDDHPNAACDWDEKSYGYMCFQKYLKALKEKV